MKTANHSTPHQPHPPQPIPFLTSFRYSSLAHCQHSTEEFTSPVLCQRAPQWFGKCIYSEVNNHL